MLVWPAIDLQKMPFLSKKIDFSDEVRFDLVARKPHAYIEKRMHPKRVTV